MMKHVEIVAEGFDLFGSFSDGHGLHGKAFDARERMTIRHRLGLGRRLGLPRVFPSAVESGLLPLGLPRQHVHGVIDRRFRLLSVAVGLEVDPVGAHTHVHVVSPVRHSRRLLV